MNQSRDLGQSHCLACSPKFWAVQQVCPHLPGTIETTCSLALQDGHSLLLISVTFLLGCHWKHPNLDSSSPFLLLASEHCECTSMPVTRVKTTQPPLRYRISRPSGCGRVKSRPREVTCEGPSSNFHLLTREHRKLAHVKVREVTIYFLSLPPPPSLFHAGG